MEEIITEYQLATLDGEVFFTGPDNTFDKVAIAGFTKLMEIYRSSENGDKPITVQMMLRTYLPDTPANVIKPMTLGYLTWSLPSKR